MWPLPETAMGSGGGMYYSDIVQSLSRLLGKNVGGKEGCTLVGLIAVKVASGCLDANTV